MSYRIVRLPASLNRRTVLRSAGAVVAVLGLGSRLQSLAAQEATPTGATPKTTQPPDWLATWDPGQTATINGADLYYEVHGNPAGQPVLLLHGGSSNAEWWVNLAPALVAAGYRVIAMDSRGHGRSAWGDLPITYAQMAADVVGLLDHLGIATTDVVGWSDGGIIVLELAIHYPERLDRVIAYAANFTPDGVQFALSNQVPPYERLIADYRRLAPEPERFEELAAVLEALYAVAPNYGEAELGSITVPVLVLNGEADEFVKPEHTQRLAELIPGSTLVLIPGTGHFAPFAQPATFAELVLEYLGRDGVGRASNADVVASVESVQDVAHEPEQVAVTVTGAWSMSVVTASCGYC